MRLTSASLASLLLAVVYYWLRLNIFQAFVALGSLSVVSSVVASAGDTSGCLRPSFAPWQVALLFGNRALKAHAAWEDREHEH